MRIASFKSKNFFLAVFAVAIAAISISAQAYGFDVHALVAQHAETLTGMSMLGIGSVDLLNKSLDKIEQGQTEIKTTQVELIDRVQKLEQKSSMFPPDLGDAKSGGDIGAMVVKAGNLDGLRNGSVKSVRVALKSLSMKAALTNATVPGVADREGEIFTALPRPISVRDLLMSRPTSAASIEYLGSTRGGAAAIQVAEGDQKAELELTLALQTAPVRTIAVWVPASRQVLDDNRDLADFINLELRDALRLEEDAQLLKGPGTGSTISGLWTNAVAYSRAQVGDTPGDTLRRAITQVQLARGVPSGIVLNPVGLEDLELEKDTEGRYLVSLTVTDGNSRAITWRVPVVVTDAIAANEFLVGDFSRAARLYDRQEAVVEISKEHADFFTRNLVAILAEERLALAVMRPNMLVKGTFAA